jgi:hypothetical protein
VETWWRTVPLISLQQAGVLVILNFEARGLAVTLLRISPRSKRMLIDPFKDLILCGVDVNGEPLETDPGICVRDPITTWRLGESHVIELIFPHRFGLL